jgi:hypothetical protein
VIPSTQGTIQSVSASSFVVAIDASPTGAYWSVPMPDDTSVFTAASTVGSFGMVFEPSTLSILAPGALLGITFTRLSPGVYEVNNVPSASTEFAPGEKFAYAIRGTGGYGFAFYSSSNISLSNVVLYTSPGAATFWVAVSGTVVLNDFQERRQPLHVMTSSADAFWTVDCPAKILIENSYFEGMGDDSINLHSWALPVSSASGARVTVSLPPASTAPSAGQTAQFSASSGVVAGMAGVQSVAPGASSTLIVDLASTVSPLSTADYLFTVQLAGHGGTPWNAEPWAHGPTMGAGAFLVNNTYGTFRGIARARSAGAVIQGNSYASQGNAQFYLHVDIPSGEGPELVAGTPMMAHFIGNTVGGGGSVVLLSADYATTSPAPE